MIRSMFSAISGLRNHQTMMDVVGNNIANVNTIGFKSSAVVFQDVLSQTLRGGGLPASELGGTNPAQVGLGSKVAAVTTSFSQGALQRTGRATDLAIQGDGFFMVKQAGQSLYTRAGAFSVDALGRLVTQDGGLVQGWQATNGAVNTQSAIGDVQLPVGSTLAPTATTTAVLTGNLPSTAPAVTSVIPANGAGSIPAPTAPTPAGSAVVTSVEVYDSLGEAVPVTITYYKTSAPSSVPATWEVRATVPDQGTAGNVFVLNLSASELQFGADGERSLPASNITIPAGGFAGAGYQAFPNAALTLDLGAAGAPGRVTGYANTNTASIASQDGSAAGSLQSFTISQQGLIVGSYSNGRTQALAQLSLASFANPEGLEKVGGSSFRASVNSGIEQPGVAGIAGRGLISSGTVEMSNVDLAQAFSDLIIAQRGFQANSRVVTSSDDMLQEIVNLKRG